MAFGKHRKGDAVELPNGTFAVVTQGQRGGLIRVEETDGAGNSTGKEMFVKPTEITETEFHD